RFSDAKFGTVPIFSATSFSPTLAGDWFVQGVPVVGSCDSIADFAAEAAAAVGIGHDRDAVALGSLSKKIAMESPVAAAVAEIPAFALLFDREPDRKRAGTDRSHHFLHRFLIQHSGGFAKERHLNFDREFRQIRRSSPESGCGLFWVDVPL